MERQFLVAQLAMLLEHGGMPCRPVSSDPVPAQVRRDQAGQLGVVIEPRGHRLQLTADLVSGEEIE